ncbi:DUF2938 domain-containing protein [Primorskyibacter sp. 2E233]|uniref:DUF2938 domain-containing protein n=1 Tax=Primorskyibacter sp. 2E233 TaxID=3413431 RepID=UPI003BF11F2A
MGLLGAGVLIGIGGTVAMDIWALILNKAFGQPLPNWGNVGRWTGHLPRGVVFHDDIGVVEPVVAETAIGWALHYGVGILYGVIFVMFMGMGWVSAPTFLPVWIFGIITIAAGWFLLHPGMGLGWALSKTDDPWRGRMMGLVAHTVFALGMYVTALLI